MCSDRTNTQMRSQLVRGADIGRGTRFVNQQNGARRSALAPTVAVTSFVRADEALVDWRLATDHSPAPPPGCPDPDDFAGPFPVSEELHTDGRP
jgi:hypothetical protein